MKARGKKTLNANSVKSGKLPVWFGVYRLVWLYRASHQFDNVHAMQGVRPFCGLISYFFPAKTPSCVRVHF